MLPLMPSLITSVSQIGRAFSIRACKAGGLVIYHRHNEITSSKAGM